MVETFAAESIDAIRDGAESRTFDALGLISTIGSRTDRALSLACFGRAMKLALDAALHTPQEERP